MDLYFKFKFMEECISWGIVGLVLLFIVVKVAIENFKESKNKKRKGDK